MVIKEVWNVNVDDLDSRLYSILEKTLLDSSRLYLISYFN